MSAEVSYFSRFFLKFVEIIAAGLASAISAYLLAHFGGGSVVLSDANFRAGRSYRQRGRRESPRPADPACPDSSCQRAAHCAAEGY
jgi:hypothetical protein